MDAMEKPGASEAAEALAALPPELAERAARVLSRPGHLLVCRREGGAVTGIVLGLARPTGRCCGW